MFIETEATPNPATLKFLPGRDVSPERPVEFRDGDQAGHSPLARALFAIDGVSGVFFGSDFITVTKTGGEWNHLKPAILGAVMEHFMTGAPILDSDAPQPRGRDEDDEFFELEDAETVAAIKDLIETRVRPAVAADGGDITFRGFRDGTVYLAMKGSCSGCPSSTATLKNGIQNLLKHFLPSVSAVEQI